MALSWTQRIRREAMMDMQARLRAFDEQIARERAANPSYWVRDTEGLRKARDSTQHCIDQDAFGCREEGLNPECLPPPAPLPQLLDEFTHVCLRVLPPAEYGTLTLDQMLDRSYIKRQHPFGDVHAALNVLSVIGAELREQGVNPNTLVWAADGRWTLPLPTPTAAGGWRWPARPPW